MNRIHITLAALLTIAPVAAMAQQPTLTLDQQIVLSKGAIDDQLQTWKVALEKQNADLQATQHALVSLSAADPAHPTEGENNMNINDQIGVIRFKMNKMKTDLDAALKAKADVSAPNATSTDKPASEAPK